MADAKSKPQRQPCEVYSRVVGYIRPVDQWNPGKQSEFDDRKTYEVLERRPEFIKVAA